MIYRLEYCNKAGVTARLDIVKGAPVPIEVIEGTAEPFILNYKMDKGDNSGFIMSSNADISVFESGTFNIDNLKTSSETELKVNHYINGVLKWSGFILPDFFSRIVGSPAIVEMVATDRLGALKAATIEPTTQYSKIRDLLILCLVKTGLSLPLRTMIDFEFSTPIIWIGNNVFSLMEIPSQRLVTPRGQRINCYDIVKAILVGSNARIVQKDGQWHIYNKMQHALGDGRVYSSETIYTNYSEEIVDFDDVEVGARRTLQPVAASVGVFHEFGGGLVYPANFDFMDGLTGWITQGVTIDTQNGINRARLQNNSSYPEGLATLRVNDIGVISTSNTRVNLSVTINLTSPVFGGGLPVLIILIAGSKTLYLNKEGVFIESPVSASVPRFYTLLSMANEEAPVGTLVTKAFTIKGAIDIVTDGDLLQNYTIRVIMRGAAVPLGISWLVYSGSLYINSCAVEFSDPVDGGKGILYKREQGDDYTKQHDIDTTIFGDHVTKGLNGYFYGIRRDEKAAITENFDGVRRRNHVWRTKFDTEPLPLLQHMAREKSRLFSETHDLLTATIEVQNFNPLAIFRACGSKRFTVVGAKFDYFRSRVELTLEEIAISSNTVREYIYSYFGDGDGDKVASISGISAASGSGSTGGGGGSWLEQYFTVNEAGTVLTAKVNFFSEGEVAAYANTDTAPNMWDNMPMATALKLGGVKAYDTYQNGIRINANGFLEIDPTYANSGVSSWTELTDRPAWLTHGTLAAFESAHGHGWSLIANKPATATRWPSWAEVTSKPTTFTPAAHNQAISTITGLQTALDGKAASSHTHSIANVTGLQTVLDAKALKAGDINQDFSVNNLNINGQVNQWLAQQLVVDDARIQVNRRQDGVTVDSGLVIYNKDTSSEVSSLVYDFNGLWRAGGQRIYTDTYKPLADNATNLGGYPAASYPRKAENTVITGKWTFGDFLNGNLGIGVTPTERLHVAGNGLFEGSVRIEKPEAWVGTRIKCTLTTGGRGVSNEMLDGLNNGWRNIFGGHLGGAYLGWQPIIDNVISASILTLFNSNKVGINTTTTPTEALGVNGGIMASGNLTVSGTSTLTGEVTAGGNVQVREAIQLANSTGTVIWTLQRNAGSDLEFRNQAGTYVGKLTQAGNFEVIGEVTAFK